MNPAAILALISQLYTQLEEQNQENARLREALQAAEDAAVGA
jgi:hypothetical protein